MSNDLRTEIVALRATEDNLRATIDNLRSEIVALHATEENLRAEVDGLRAALGEGWLSVR